MPAPPGRPPSVLSGACPTERRRRAGARGAGALSPQGPAAREPGAGPGGGASSGGPPSTCPAAGAEPRALRACPARPHRRQSPAVCAGLLLSPGVLAHFWLPFGYSGSAGARPCACVCVRVRAYMCMCARAHMRVSACMCIVCARVHVYVHMYACVHVSYMGVRVHIYVHVCACVRVHTRARVCVRVCTHVCAHPRIQGGR